MARTRTPPPPRRVQAPKTRVDQDQRRTRLILLAVAALGFVGLAVAVGLIAFGRGGGGSEDVATAMRDAGCTFRTVKSPVHKGDHSDVPTLDSKVTWNTDPPSNGAHYQLWAVWNFYDEPVNPRLAVHNEEHGGVVIWWGSDVPQETVDRLREFYQDDPLAMLGTPYPKLGDKIALTAWTGDPATYFENGDYGEGRIAICPSFDQDAFEAFRDAFRGEGPEPVPVEQNQPGSGPGG